jgi:hypothetical protein
MATEIFINTDLKDLTANVVANRNRPTQVVRLPQIVEGEKLDVELSLVDSSGSYNSLSGDSSVSLAVAVSAKGAAATSGTFTLTAGTETTAAIAYNASGQAVQDALNALNSNAGAYGSTVVVTKLAAGSYRVIFDTVGARTIFGGTSIDLAPESEVVAATSVVGSSTIRAQQVIEISQQPAIYTSIWTAGTNKFTGQLDANTARVQEFIAAGLEAYLEVKVDDEVVSQVPVKLLPAVAAPNSLPAHELPSNINEFAADPSTNGSFSVTNWLADLLAPHTKAVWGYITGTLSDQTDLQTALDAKASASDVSTNTADIATNTADIATNTADIATNTADIATNTADIATKANASTVATLVTDVSSNTTNILSNYNTIISAQGDIDDLGEQILAKADKASPTFTGTTTAPKIVSNEIESSGDIVLDAAQEVTITGNCGIVGDLNVNGDHTINTGRLNVREIQCQGGTINTAIPINYDAKEHRFRDFDENPNDLMVIKKVDGRPGGRVGINPNGVNPKCALHVIHNSSDGYPSDEAIRCTGGLRISHWLRLGQYTDSERDALGLDPPQGTVIYNEEHDEIQAFIGNPSGGRGTWKAFTMQAVSS